MAGTVRAAVLVKPQTIEFGEYARPATGRDDTLLESGLHIALVPGAPRVAIA
ncbi:MAG TPA: hypothetical protein VMS64_34390 [Candidatus Methylomirabilis sp.]|nr:hypothetical protein [Candidatus Methylomirabilis sp.]